MVTIQLLGAAVAVLLWVMLVYETEITEIVTIEGKSVEQLELRREISSHAAFLGSAAATFMGLSHESLIAAAFAVVWFVGWLNYSKVLTSEIQELKEHEEAVHWRKLAGMIRSVVKSELDKGNRG